MIILKQTGRMETTHPFDLTDRGLLLADGVFDTSLVTNGQVFLREAHLNRLCADAAALEITVDRDWIERTIDETISDSHTGALRVTVTRGPGERGLVSEHAASATLLLRLSELDTSRPLSPLSLMTSQITRNPDSITTRHKTLSYTDNIMAARIAGRAGFDDALMLNTFGRITCSSSANIFARYGNEIVTPPTSEGALGGIMRDWLLIQLPDFGFEVSERTLSPEELMRADQVFVSNSLRLIAPVSRIDSHSFETSLSQALEDHIRGLTRLTSVS